MPTSMTLPEATSRRDFLWQSGGGLGGLALAWLVGQEDGRADLRRKAT